MTTELDIINNIALVVSGAIAGAVFSLLIYLILDIIRKRRDRKETAMIIIVDIELKLIPIINLAGLLQKIINNRKNVTKEEITKIHNVFSYYDESRFLILFPKLNLYKLNEIKKILDFYDTCRFSFNATAEAIKTNEYNSLTVHFNQILGLTVLAYEVLSLLYHKFTKDKDKVELYRKKAEEVKKASEQLEM